MVYTSNEYLFSHIISERAVQSASFCLKKHRIEQIDQKIVMLLNYMIINHRIEAMRSFIYVMHHHHHVDVIHIFKYEYKIKEMKKTTEFKLRNFLFGLE